MNKIFNPTILFILCIALLLTLGWYGDINTIRYEEYTQTETNVSKSTIKDLEKRNAFDNFDSQAKYKYWAKRELKIKKKKTKIPFKYKRDTISRQSWTFYRKKID